MTILAKIVIQISTLGSYEYKGWKGFWKVVKGTSKDVGIHHLWITNAPNATHQVMIGSGKDQDILSNVSGSTVVYLMWGTQKNEWSSNYIMESLVEKTNKAFGKKIF